MDVGQPAASANPRICRGELFRVNGPSHTGPLALMSAKSFSGIPSQFLGYWKLSVGYWIFRRAARTGLVPGRHSAAGRFSISNIQQGISNDQGQEALPNTATLLAPTPDAIPHEPSLFAGNDLPRRGAGRADQLAGAGPVVDAVFHADQTRCGKERALRMPCICIRPTGAVRGVSCRTLASPEGWPGH